MAGLNGNTVNPINNERHIAAEQLAHALGDLSERVLGTDRAFRRASEMAHHHDRGACIERHANGRNARHKTGFVRNAAFRIMRGIKVAANENALALEGTCRRQLFKRQNLHLLVAPLALIFK